MGGVYSRRQTFLGIHVNDPDLVVRIRRGYLESREEPTQLGQPFFLHGTSNTDPIVPVGPKVVFDRDGQAQIAKRFRIAVGLRAFAGLTANRNGVLAKRGDRALPGFRRFEGASAFRGFALGGLATGFSFGG